MPIHIGAYLTGADFTRAKIHGATFEQATLTGAKGFPPAGKSDLALIVP
jgi:uncharacterized protein YjbI with pentapeptide repeats